MLVSRRRFGLTAASASLLLACGDEARLGAVEREPAIIGSGQGGEGAGKGDGGPGGSPGAGGDDGGGGAGGAGGELLGIVPFIDDGDTPLETPLGVGWDGRLYTDLAQLDAGSLVTTNDNFYVRTRYPDLLDPSAPWRVDIGGLVDAPSVLTLDDLLPLAAARGVHLLECSGNSRGGAFGLMSATSWDGIAMTDLLARVAVSPAATRVLVSGFDGHSVPSANGHSKPGASWVFTFAQLERAFLATAMNGEPLPPDHGAPLRLLVPGWYGCTAIKWVERITLVGEGEPATAQMQEFASRTHQDGVPKLSADYKPASIQQAAMPIRVERWRDGTDIFYRVVGILWGGSRLTDAVSIRFGDEPWANVSVSPPPTTNATWTLWSHTWRPAGAGQTPIRMRIDDQAIPTLRLDIDYYLRTIAV